jgi:hypothetical protein
MMTTFSQSFCQVFEVAVFLSSFSSGLCLFVKFCERTRPGNFARSLQIGGESPLSP